MFMRLSGISAAWSLVKAISGDKDPVEEVDFYHPWCEVCNGEMPRFSTYDPDTNEKIIACKNSRCGHERRAPL